MVDSGSFTLDMRWHGGEPLARLGDGNAQVLERAKDASHRVARRWSVRLHVPRPHTSLPMLNIARGVSLSARRLSVPPAILSCHKRGIPALWDAQPHAVK